MGGEREDVLLGLASRRHERLQGRGVRPQELWAVGEVAAALRGGVIDAEEDSMAFPHALRIVVTLRYPVDAVAGAPEDDVGARAVRVVLILEDSVDAGELRA